MICITHDSTCCLKVKVTVEGYEFELVILCQLHISFMPGRVFNSISVELQKADNERLSAVKCCLGLQRILSPV